MRRAAVVAFAAGAVALGATAALAVLTDLTVMPSYLAAWLFWLALPVGTLPLLMLLELTGIERTASVSPALRRLLMAAPAVFVLIAPLLFRLGDVYPWTGPDGPGGGLGRLWWQPSFFIARSIVYLLIWLVLAMVFIRPPEPEAGRGRRALAIAGLMLHVVVVTLAAIDWVMSVQSGWYSAEFGLLLLVAQCAIALAGAVLIGDRAHRRPTPSLPGLFLLVLAAAWMFLHFMQFLVVWAGDLPQEIAWYLPRDAGIGAATAWLGAFGGFVLPFLVLLAPEMRRRRAVVMGVAGLILLVHLVEMLWLVTPSFRGRFVVTATDLLVLVGIGGFAIGSMLTFAETREARVQVGHG